MNGPGKFIGTIIYSIGRQTILQNQFEPKLVIGAENMLDGVVLSMVLDVAAN